MREEGLEPPSLAAPDSKPGAFTSFATRAFQVPNRGLCTTPLLCYLPLVVRATSSTRPVGPVAAFLTVGVLVACGGPTNNGGQDAGTGPRIATIPARIDFGIDAGTAVKVGLAGTATLTIKNSGSGVLTMTSVTLSGDPEFTATRPAAMSLDAGEGTDVTVTFSPMDVRNYSGRITIQSNAKNVPTAGITVQGKGEAP